MIRYLYKFIFIYILYILFVDDDSYIFKKNLVNV